MTCDNSMIYLFSENSIDFFKFKPSFFKLYFNKKEIWTPFRKSILHKFHMILYLMGGGYNILYAISNDEVLGYLVYTKSKKWIIENSNKNDLYTIYITTNPNYRRNGLATKLVGVLLNNIEKDFVFSYKTIDDNNYGSIKAALNNGYEKLYPIKKCGIMKTIKKVNASSKHLYVFRSKNENFNNS